ncbi:hypothetical protein HDU82_004338 [Entophlyctis luteolus]|nr:hypothetical protein HDU82_004338 [Entophlyctis luteolus]
MPPTGASPGGGTGPGAAGGTDRSNASRVVIPPRTQSHGFVAVDMAIAGLTTINTSAGRGAGGNSSSSNNSNNSSNNSSGGNGGGSGGPVKDKEANDNPGRFMNSGAQDKKVLMAPATTAALANRIARQRTSYLDTLNINPALVPPQPKNLPIVPPKQPFSGAKSRSTSFNLKGPESQQTSAFIDTPKVTTQLQQMQQMQQQLFLQQQQQKSGNAGAGGAQNTSSSVGIIRSPGEKSIALQPWRLQSNNVTKPSTPAFSNGVVLLPQTTVVQVQEGGLAQMERAIMESQNTPRPLNVSQRRPIPPLPDFQRYLPQNNYNANQGLPGALGRPIPRAPLMKPAPTIAVINTRQQGSSGQLPPSKPLQQVTSASILRTQTVPQAKLDTSAAPTATTAQDHITQLEMELESLFASTAKPLSRSITVPTSKNPQVEESNSGDVGGGVILASPDMTRALQAQIAALESKNSSLKLELSYKERRIEAMGAYNKETEKRLDQTQQELRDRDSKLRKLRGDRGSVITEVSLNSSKRVKSLRQGIADLEILRQTEVDELRSVLGGQLKARDQEIERLTNALQIQLLGKARVGNAGEELAINALKEQLEKQTAKIKLLESKISSSNLYQTEQSRQAIEQRMKTLEAQQKLELEALRYEVDQSKMEYEDVLKSFEDSELKREAEQLQHSRDMKELAKRQDLEINDWKDKFESMRIAFDKEKDSLLANLFNAETSLELAKKSHAKALKALTEKHDAQLNQIRQQMDQSGPDQFKSAKALVEVNLASSAQERRNAEQKLQVSTASSAQIDALNSQIADLKNQVLILENSKAEAELQAKDKIDALVAQVGKLKAENAADSEFFKEEVEKLEQSRLALEIELNSSTYEFDSIIEQLRNAEGAKSALEKDVEGLKLKLQSTPGNESRSVSQLQSYSGSERMREELLSTREKVFLMFFLIYVLIQEKMKLDAVERKNMKNQQLISSLKAEIAGKSPSTATAEISEQHELKVRQLQDELAKSKSDLKEAQDEQIASLKLNLSETLVDVDKARAATQTIRVLQAEIEDLDEKLNNALLDLKDVNEYADECEKEITRLKGVNTITSPRVSIRNSYVPRSETGRGENELKIQLAESQKNLQEQTLKITLLEKDTINLNKKLQDAKSDLDLQISANAEEVEKLEQLIKSLSKQALDSQQNADEAQSENDRLQNSIQQLQAKSSSLEVVIQQRDELVRELEEKCEEHLSRIAELEKATESARTAFARDLALQKETIADLEDRLADAEDSTAVQELEAVCASQKSAIQSLETQVAELKDSAVRHKLEAELESQRALVLSLQAELDEARNSNEFKDLEAAFVAQKAQINVLQNKLSECVDAAEYDELQDAYDSQQVKIQSLQTQLSEAANNSDDLASQCEEQKKKIEALLAQLSQTATSQSPDIGKLEADLTAKKKEIESLQEKLSESVPSSKFSELQAAYTALKDLANSTDSVDTGKAETRSADQLKAMEELQTKLSTYMPPAEVEKLNVKIAEQQAKIDAFEEKLQNVEISELQMELAAQKATIKSLEADLSERLSEFKELEADYAEKKRRIEVLEDEISQSSSNVDDMVQLDILTQEKNQLVSNLEALTNKMEKLRNDSAANENQMMEEIEELKRKNSELLTKLEGIEQKDTNTDDLEDEIENLKFENGGLLEQYRELELRAGQNEEALRKEVFELQARLQDNSGSVFTESKAVDSDRVQELEDEISRLAQQANDYYNELELLDKEIETLELSLESSQKQCQEMESMYEGKLEKLVQELKVAEAKLGNGNDEQSASKSEPELLLEKVVAAQKEKQLLIDQLDSLKEDYASVQQREADLQAELKMLQGVVEETKSRESIDIAEMERLTANADADRLVETIRKLCIEVRFLKEKNQKLEDQVATYLDGIASLQSKVKFVESALQSSSEIIIAASEGQSADMVQVLLQKVAELSDERDSLLDENEMLVTKLVEYQNQHSPQDEEEAPKKKGFFF